MKTIKWKEEWTLGQESIDFQHKKLICILNRIIVNKFDTYKIVADLIEYAAMHFIDEENFMASQNYPKDLIDAHRKEHKEFTKLLLETSFGLMRNRSPEIAIEFKEFCFAWFKFHFLNTDKKLIEFLKGGANTKSEPNK